MYINAYKSGKNIRPGHIPFLYSSDINGQQEWRSGTDSNILIGLLGTKGIQWAPGEGKAAREYILS